MHWTGFGLDGKYWKLQKCGNVHFWSTKKHGKCIEMAIKWRWNAICEMKHKSVGIQQNATESVGWAVCVWKDTGGFVVGRRNFSGCRIREQSALDNPRADVYNKDKERRCPHSGQLPSLSVTLENMTAEVWELRAVIFLVIIFSNRVLRGASHEKSLGQASKWSWPCQWWQWPKGWAGREHYSKFP